MDEARVHVPHVAIDEEVGRRERVVVQARGLNLALEIGELEDLVAGHTLVLQRLAGLAAKRGNLNLVMLEQERAEHRAGRCAVRVTHLISRISERIIEQDGRYLPMATFFSAKGGFSGMSMSNGVQTSWKRCDV
jgi:hypothetical protein